MLKIQKAILTGLAIGALAAVGSGQTARAMSYPIAIAGDNTGAMNVNWGGIGGPFSIHIPNGFLKSNCGAPFNNNVTIDLPPIGPIGGGYHWNAVTQAFDQELGGGPPLVVTDNITLQPYLVCNMPGLLVLHGVNGSSSVSLTLEQDFINYGMAPNQYFPAGVPPVAGSISIEFVTANPVVAGAAGVNAFTANDGITFGVQPPGLPTVTGLTATPGNNKVILNWTNLGSGITYTVARSLVSGGPYTNISVGQIPSTYTDLTAVNGTTYYYVVNATSFFGTGPNSAQVSATPLPPPAAPTALSAITGPGRATLHWTASATATSYTVLRAVVNGGPYTSVAAGIVPTGYVNTGLTAGTTYYFVVTATNLGGTSGNSNQASVIPCPLAPTNLVGTPGVHQAALTWTASTGATSYNVYRGAVTGGPYTAVASGITVASYTDTGLTTNVTYFYVVTALNAVGESPNSKEVSVKSN